MWITRVSIANPVFATMVMVALWRWACSASARSWAAV